MKKYLVILALMLCVAFESFAQFSGFPGFSGFPSIGSSGNNTTKTDENKKNIGLELSYGFSNVLDEYNGAFCWSLGLDVKLGKFKIGLSGIENFNDPHDDTVGNTMSINTSLVFDNSFYAKIGYAVYSKNKFEISANVLYGSVSYIKHNKSSYGWDGFDFYEIELIGFGVDCFYNFSKFFGIKFSMNSTNEFFMMDTSAVIRF